MTAALRTRWQKATALVPLALLSAAWTASLAGVGSAIEGAAPTTLPDGTVVPAEAHEHPASYTRPGGPGVPSGSADRVVAAVSTNGIPSAALNAYQRARSVMSSADRACNIGWQLIAAIGRVESDHGRYGGSTLGVDGVSRPGIYGIALNGRNRTKAISDTDAGLYDNDEVWDRAVGPMQFIPSTWSVVGVDADGDARRNPQDIDDAALAAAVHLCSGPNTAPGANLATEPGQRAAVFRYNHSDEYVDLVLAVMNAYLEGDYTSVPNYVSSAVTFTPGFAGTRATVTVPKKNGSRDTGSGTATTGGTPPPATEPAPPAEAPVHEPAPVAGEAVRQVEKTVKEATALVAELLTLPQAIVRCTSLGYNPLLTRAAWNACVAGFTTGPVS